MVYLDLTFVPVGAAFIMIIYKLNFFRLHISDEQLKSRMLMAVPKKGRLYDQCIRLLERAGIKVIIRIDIFTNLLTHIEGLTSIFSRKATSHQEKRFELNFFRTVETEDFLQSE